MTVPMPFEDDDDAGFDALLEAFKRDPSDPRPDWALDPDRSISEQLEQVPFFMTRLPDDISDNVQLQALQSLLYDGTPEEVAANFKEQGNDAFRRGVASYKDALAHYTKGLDQRCADAQLNAQLLANRAAVHLALKNFGYAARDAAQSLSLDRSNVKTFWRAAKASLELERIDDASRFVAAGLAAFPDSTELLSLKTGVDEGRRKIDAAARTREQALRETRLVREAMAVRGVTFRPDAEKTVVSELGPGVFGSDPPRVQLDGDLKFPAVLLYPPCGQFDLIASVSEHDTLLDHLAAVFSTLAPWDTQSLYAAPSSMSAYMRPVNRPDSDAKIAVLYRVSLHTPISRLLGSVIRVFDLGILGFYILPNEHERVRFEDKFRDAEIRRI